MQVTPLAIPDVILFEPQIYSDERGFFFENFNLKKFSNIVGRNVVFVQDNQSYSRQGVLRGLHYQVIKPQGKLVSVVHGEVFDVAVDIRLSSPTYGQWVGRLLSAENRHQLWIPEGFAHGFLVLSESAVFQYKVTDYWFPEYERCIRFNDEKINIQWPTVMCGLTSKIIAPNLSLKDREGSELVFS